MSSQDFMLVVILIALGSSMGVAALAAIFVRRQRVALVRALQDAAQLQVGTVQQLTSTIDHLQRQQRQHEQQLQNVAQATLRLRQDLAAFNKRLEREQEETAPRATGDRVIH